ncbi:MAG: ATP-dependent DNA helicase RecG [Deltaproteobacteria bacterium]|nr:ATP-dependent DNA helicase RecG [Deltaproteobacteria bacterium]
MAQMTQNPLDNPIQYIKGVGPKLSKLFLKKGIETVEDALYFVPRVYEDRRTITPIGKLGTGQTATILAEVLSTKKSRGVRNSGRFEARLSDGSGTIQFFWFHAHPSLEADFEQGKKILACGEVRFYNGAPQIVHPEYEAVHQLVDGKPVISANFGRVVPIYSETDGLHQKTIRRIMAEVLKTSIPHLGDSLPTALLKRLALPSLQDSFTQLHFPAAFPIDDSFGALKRIIFEEFFILELGLGLKKQKHRSQVAPAIGNTQTAATDFIKTVPFNLTEDQKSVLHSILADLEKAVPMTRLIQGDVGSGKTVVALAASVAVARAGFQSVMMAPTEVLAQQHFRVANNWLSKLGISVCLITHSNSSQKEIKTAISKNNMQLIIGTHAVFQERLDFGRLALVIVDEQHRFGVEQRNELVRKGESAVPHLLMMTATPIPRTLALTLYGDLDLSIIRQKPAGRQAVKTHIVWDKDRPKLYQKIREAVRRGEQVYIIYPLIETSESLDLKSATDMHAKLSREIFPELSVALLHGKMKSTQKDETLQEFKQGKYSILVSTTVIEVGIDVPNATLMIIEHPERLGLSQLHQLRGRVGRGSAKAECVLVADRFATERLRIMERTNDGFEIAEEDLRIRGPGEFLGTRQHGLPGFRVGHILRDASLLVLARDEATRILEEDPHLMTSEHKGIRAMVESRWKEKIERLRGG